ncbi:MAG TPA: hypothetical protein ENG60_02035 [Thermoplasmatales archaeon]|nr:hypothetical protein [Thermoplasmatales archaeon]HEX17182.1 hypothetical protein [Thermoplasmatales archaeon]
MSLERYILMMLAIKREGKLIDLNHVVEKAERDVGAKEEEIKKALKSLIERGLVLEKGGLFAITKEGREFFRERFGEWKGELTRINRTWATVYEAMNYYRIVGDTVVNYCKDRHVGFYCTFTQQHFFKRQHRGKYITIDSREDLLEFVQMFCIDVIPCVHRIGSDRPEWLIIDLDAGPKVGFERVKEVAEVSYDVMEKLGMKPSVKFSGSRGMQIWSKPRPFNLPDEWEPIPMLTEKRKRNFFSLFADLVRLIQYKVDQEIPGITTSVVSKKAEREDKILMDWSCLKPNGLVRSPYGIHHKTGLVSLPLDVKEIEDFVPEDAEPERVAEEFKGDKFKLRESDFSSAIRELLDLKDRISL